MPTYVFSNFSEPITADSWTWEFAGVKYIDGVSQDGFTADIILHSVEGKNKGVCVINETERPESPMSDDTLITWIELNLISYET